MGHQQRDTWALTGSVAHPWRPGVEAIDLLIQLLIQRVQLVPTMGPRRVP
jgi:hypothetical protein